LVASQSCNHGPVFQESKWTCHICGRRAGQQAQHPGENLQRYGLDKTWVQVMKGQAGLLNGELWLCRGTASPRMLQLKIQTVHLTVELLLTARVLAVCDCLLTERSPRMC